MGEGPNDRGLSRKHLTEQMTAILQRLQMDYVHILYCHRFDGETPLYETLRTLDDFIRAGKALYIGVSEWTADVYQSQSQYRARQSAALRIHAARHQRP